MPVYQYRCSDCRHLQEALQKMDDPPLAECEKCHGKLQKIIAPVGIIFKGSGWHINDYKPSGNAETPATEKAGSPASDAGSSSESAAPAAPASDAGSTSPTPPPPPTAPPPSSSQKQVA